MEMRTNQLIKNKQEMKMNRINHKNYILMEVEDLKEQEAVEVKEPEEQMLVSLEHEDREIMIKIVNLVVNFMKQKRRITKFKNKTQLRQTK